MAKHQLDIFHPQNPDEKYFRISVCGRQSAEKGHTVSSKVYPDHNFTFVLNGCGTFHSKFGDYHITPGKGYFIQAGSEVSYEADYENPWEYIFVSFCGEACDNFLKYAGISAGNPDFSFALEDETIHILDQIIRASNENRNAGYDVLGYFYLLVSKLMPNDEEIAENTSDKRINDIVRFIELNYQHNITVKELSERFFIDRSGIYRTFERRFGISPKKYILRCRLMNAAQMLCDCDSSVTKIAYDCGFFDHAHFSKSFNKFFGMSPAEYRHRNSI